MAKGFQNSVAAAFIAEAIAVACPWSESHAVPSFARQTGLPCSACHTAYPQLTAFGREFKLNGYTFGGGDSDLPPLSAVFQPSFTHTQKSQPGGAAPHFDDNDNPALSQASVIYGGKIFGNLGAFSQFTYDGVARRFAIDNTDIRYADTAKIAGADFVYGLTLNNNPTVQDLWNTTPAWRFPFASSPLAPEPAASTLIGGGLAQQVVGFGGYARWNRLVYAEITGYRTLSRRSQTVLGISPEGEDRIRGVAPYWRVALEHDFGDSNLSFGTFGLAADTFPGRDQSMGADHRLDLGLDGQWEYSVAPHTLGLYLRWTHERAEWTASKPLGNTDNPKDSLDSVSASVSYLYDLTYGFDLGFFSTTGGADATLYGSRTGKPDTDRVHFQLDYLPFNKDGGPSFWTWLNPKFVLQYTMYTKFDGARSNFDGNGRNASDNDTLYLLMWAPL